MPKREKASRSGLRMKGNGDFQKLFKVWGKQIAIYSVSCMLNSFVFGNFNE